MSEDEALPGLSEEETEEFFGQMTRCVQVLEMMGLTRPVPGMRPTLNKAGRDIVGTGMVLLAMHEPEEAIGVFDTVRKLAIEAKRHKKEQAMREGRKAAAEHGV